MLPPNGGAGVAPTPEICLEARRLLAEAKKALAAVPPDFKDGTYHLEWIEDEQQYKVVITDTSGTLAHWAASLTASVEAYNLKYSGDHLKIVIDADGGTITLTADKLTGDSIDLSATSDELLAEAKLIYMFGGGTNSKVGGYAAYQDMISVETVETELHLTLTLTLTRVYDAALQKWVSRVIRGGAPLQGVGEDVVADGVPSEVWTVRRGDIVEYKIRVVNQCHEILKIPELVDYPPEWLKFDET
jgi:hypothetical protein